MSFFNGEFKRGRVVNLGSSNSQLSKAQILQKAREQREKRREAKRQQNAACTLQKHIRAYLNLQSSRAIIYRNWSLVDQSETGLNAAYFRFHFCYPLIKANHQELETSLQTLNNLLDRRINNVNIRLLFDDLSRSLEGLLKLSFQKNDWSLSTKCLSLLYELSVFAKERSLKTLDVDIAMDAIDTHIAALIEYRPQAASIALDTVLSLGSVSEAIKLCGDNNLFNRLLDNHQSALLSTVIDQISQSKNVLNVTDMEKLVCLANVSEHLKHIEEESLTKQMIDGAVVLALSINNLFITEKERDDTGHGKSLVVLDPVAQKLDYILSKEFLQMVFSSIERRIVSPAIISTLYSSVMKLRPNAMKNTFVYFYLFGLSEIKQLVFNESSSQNDDLNSLNLVNNKKIFSYIENLQDSESTAGRNLKFLQTFLPLSFDSHVLKKKAFLNYKFFDKDLYFFLEIFSYWLIISTEDTLKNLPKTCSESSDNPDFLTKSELLRFSQFLKNLCLVINWNSTFIYEKLRGGKSESRPKPKSGAFGDTPQSAFGNADLVPGGSSGHGSAFGSTSSAFGLVFQEPINTDVEMKTDSPDITDTEDDPADDYISFQEPSLHDFLSLKKSCIKVMNQINLIDSLISILPEGFWSVDDRRLEDPEKLFPLIQNEEKYRETLVDDSDDDSDYESSDSESLPKRKRFGASFTQGNESLEGVLSLLNNHPYFIPFKHRAKIFQKLINLDRSKNEFEPEFSLSNFINGVPQSGTISAIVHRGDRLLDDAYEAVGSLRDNFKAKFSVTFVDQYGKNEEGIDGGGLTKEFLTSVAQEGFNNPYNGLFVENREHLLYPNPNTILNLKYNNRFMEDHDLKQWELEKLGKIEFLGKVIGKCLYEGILVDVSFVPFFLKRWKSGTSKSSYNDLNDIDPELYNGLNKLTKLKDDFFESSEMNFTITEKVTFHKPAIIDFDPDSNEHVIVENEYHHSEMVTIDLIPGGSEIAVRNINKLQFINAVTNFKINRCINPQIDLFLKGLHQIIPSHWIEMFNPAELQTLISGGEKDIDIEDFKRNVVYGGYTENDQTIIDFWECVEEMTPQERFKLLKFVTSVPRAPLLGFGDMNPKFGIRNPLGEKNRYPTAATCFNLLRIPDYRNKKLLKKNLLFVINADAGFDLS